MVRVAVVTEEMRRELASRDVTLNGKPARIVGVKNDYATVRHIAHDGESYDWTWASAHYIVHYLNGRFES